jgi:hypothetical protein
VWIPARKKRTREPALVGSVLSRTKTATARLAGVSLDWITWREVVGERVARRSVPGKINDGVLVVGVESPVWAQELSLLSDEVVSRLRSRGYAVSAIRFRPTAPAERASQTQKPERRPPPAPLPEELQKRLELIDDVALRETIAAAASHSLGARAARQERALAKKQNKRQPR